MVLLHCGFCFSSKTGWSFPTAGSASLPREDSFLHFRSSASLPREDGPSPLRVLLLFQKRLVLLHCGFCFSSKRRFLPPLQEFCFSSKKRIVSPPAVRGLPAGRPLHGFRERLHTQWLSRDRKERRVGK